MESVENSRHKRKLPDFHLSLCSAESHQNIGDLFQNKYILKYFNQNIDLLFSFWYD